MAGMLGPRGNFNQFAFQQQVDSGDRRKISPNQWLMDVVVKRGDDDYYNNVKPIYTELANAGLPSQVLSTMYQGWLSDIDNKYPGWLQWHAGGSAREAARQSAVNELGDALQDPRVPKGAGLDKLRDFYQLYGQMKTILTASGVQGFNTKLGKTLAPILVASYNSMKDDKNPGPLDEAYKLLFRYELEGFAPGGQGNQTK